MADVCHYIVGLLPYSYSIINGQQELTKIPTLCCSKRSKGSSRLSYDETMIINLFPDAFVLTTYVTSESYFLK